MKQGMFLLTAACVLVLLARGAVEARALEVAAVKPDAADAREVHQITITFNQPVVPLGDFEQLAEGLPVTITPPLPDLPVTVQAGRGVFFPSNYGGSFSGPRQIRYALANSKNLPALFLASQLGETRVLDHLQNMGFDSLRRPAGHYGAGIVLGNGEVTLWNLGQAYSTLARLGLHKKLTYLARGVESDSREERRVLDERTAYMIADALSDAEARAEEFGRGGPLEFAGQVAVRTGTSSDYRDHWTLGFTRDHTVGVWRGNADGRPLVARGSTWIFHRVMELAGGQAPRWLPRPPGLVTRRVCSLSGDPVGPHCPGGGMKYSAKRTRRKNSATCTGR
ncbi:MAG: hypothetical protein JSU88_12180 [Nitrospinaceae bacterium]|nr:MAG: hypothetical protein JSU88_12180 [Nitrospinaceae bacterium]